MAKSCPDTTFHYNKCVSHSESRIGIAINTVYHHMSMIPMLISGLHLANISSSAIHLFVGNASQDMFTNDHCEHIHTNINDNVSRDQRVVLHARFF